MKKFIPFVALLVGLSIPQIASACSCATGDAAQEFNGVTGVFIGKMMGGTEKFADRSGGELEAGKVTFQVEQLFKGNLSSEVTLNVDSMRGTSCGDYGLKRGETYIVWAYENKEKKGTYYTGVCTRTALTKSDYVKDDLNFLRNLPALGSGGNIQGRVWLDVKRVYGGSAEPFKSITVQITDDAGKTVKVITNDRGEFELKGIKAGSYIVRPMLPSGYVFEKKDDDDDDYRVQVNDRGTASAGFEAYYDAEISGRLTDKAGTPVDDFMLQVKTVDGEKEEHHTYVDDEEDGNFVGRAIPPGRYLLYLELRHEDYDKNRKYYYPGTFDEKEAIPINIKTGSRVSNLNFTLPEEFRVRTIAGQALWKNGKPASDIEVLLLCPTSTLKSGLRISSMPPRISTDESGRFAIQVFSGELYSIEARGSENGKPFHSISQPVTADRTNTKPLSLTLSEPGFGGGCSSPKK